MVPMMTKLIGALAALTLLLSGCAELEDVPEDTALSAALDGMVGTGESARLEELTGGDWDLVYVFDMPTTREYVEEKIGIKLNTGHIIGWYEGPSLLVFMSGGQMQRAVHIKPGCLPEGVYSDRVVVSSSGEPDEVVLEMSEELGEPVGRRAGVAAGKRLP